MSKRLTEHEKEQMIKRIEHLSKKRHSMAHFPLNAEGLYALYERQTPEDVNKAVNTLWTHAEYRDLLNATYMCKFMVGDFALATSFTGSPLPILWALKGIRIPEDDPDYTKLYEFAELKRRIVADSQKFSQWARHLVYSANAAGQIKRVWPEIMPLVGSEAYESTRDTQRASRLPTEFDYVSFCEHREELNKILAEARMLQDVVYEPEVTVEVGIKAK